MQRKEKKLRMDNEGEYASGGDGDDDGTNEYCICEGLSLSLSFLLVSPLLVSWIY